MAKFQKALDMSAQKAHTEVMTNATPNQISFYNSLLDTIVRLAPAGQFDPAVIAACRENYPSLTTKEASDAITRAKNTADRLKAAAPTVQAPVAAAAASVPSGHYALVVDGIVKFYRVNAVTEGKWAGYTFVDAQASDDYHKVGREASRVVLAAIAADPETAMRRYGLELGVCGHCRRTLTNDESRKYGIGPICRGRMGF